MAQFTSVLYPEKQTTTDVNWDTFIYTWTCLCWPDGKCDVNLTSPPGPGESGDTLGTVWKLINARTRRSLVAHPNWPKRSMFNLQIKGGCLISKASKKITWSKAIKITNADIEYEFAPRRWLNKPQPCLRVAALKCHMGRNSFSTIGGHQDGQCHTCTLQSVYCSEAR